VTRFNQLYIVLGCIAQAVYSAYRLLLGATVDADAAAGALAAAAAAAVCFSS
jgi:hypothetical protein